MNPTQLVLLVQLFGEPADHIPTHHVYDTYGACTKNGLRVASKVQEQYKPLIEAGDSVTVWPICVPKKGPFLFTST